MSSALKKIVDRFSNLKVLVIGDVMLDSYIFGTASRISPEAPVPVVNVNRTESRPGGAANVAMNINALGGQAVICSVVGKDIAGKKLLTLLKSKKFNTSRISISSLRTTTEKTRVFSRSHQMLRFDHETESPLTPGNEKELIRNITAAIRSEKFDVIVLQDYNKGVLTPNVIRESIAAGNKWKIPVAVDPKKNNFFEYNKATLFKPNLRELNEALQTDIDKSSAGQLFAASQTLRKRLHHKLTLVTLSENGLFATDHRTSALVPASLREIADVSGAGDTVLSVAAMCLATDADFRDIAHLANLAGGIACTEVGVIPVSRKQLLWEVELYRPNQ